MASCEERWAYIKTYPKDARHLLSLLLAKMGAGDDFDALIDRLIASRSRDLEGKEAQDAQDEKG